jgi:hypothetical protein
MWRLKIERMWQTRGPASIAQMLQALRAAGLRPKSNFGIFRPGQGGVYLVT